MVPRFGGQHSLCLAGISALRGKAGNVYGSGGLDLPASALSSGVATVCPRLVRRAAHVGHNSRDIRDRAILLLLAVYGMRRGEVAALRLDQIDWAGRTLRLFRLKRRQPQIYPLVPSAAEALARYIDMVRPLSSCPEVFLCMHAPRRPLKAGSIYDVANRRFVALGIDAAHRGGHALRHACASRLLAEGLSIKEIGDHLGHRSAASTSIYAKVNMQALREVGAFDLGGLQ